MGYGGDFGDEPNDYNFVMDGLCFANHDPGPGLLEYSKALEPIQLVGSNGLEVEIVNRYDFLTLDHLKCHWEFVSDRSQIIGRDVFVPKGVKPHSTTKLVVGGFPTTTGSSEVWLRLEFYRIEGSGWTYPGQKVAALEIPLSPPKSLVLLKTPTAARGLRVQSKDGAIYATLANGTTFGISTTNGSFFSITRPDKPDVNLITVPMSLDFYRALTDNDQTRHHFTRITTMEEKGTCKIVVEGRVAPPVLAWSVDTVTTYTITPEHCSIHIKAKPHGRSLPSTFARFGLTLA